MLGDKPLRVIIVGTGDHLVLRHLRKSGCEVTEVSEAALRDVITPETPKITYNERKRFERPYLKKKKGRS